VQELDDKKGKTIIYLFAFQDAPGNKVVHIKGNSESKIMIIKTVK